MPRTLCLDLGAAFSDVRPHCPARVCVSTTAQIYKSEMKLFLALLALFGTCSAFNVAAAPAYARASIAQRAPAPLAAQDTYDEKTAWIRVPSSEKTGGYSKYVSIQVFCFHTRLNPVCLGIWASPSACCTTLFSSHTLVLLTPCLPHQELTPWYALVGSMFFIHDYCHYQLGQMPF